MGDQLLLSLIDAQFDVDSCRKFYGATWTPVGLALGWFTGLTVGSAIATPVAGLTFGVICSVAGALNAFSLGSDSGVGFAQYAMNELLNQTEIDEKDLKDDNQSDAQKGLEMVESNVDSPLEESEDELGFD